MAKIEVMDTNVLASVGKLPPDDEIEANCIIACIEWFKVFREGDENYKLAVDIGWKILNEYRGQVKQGSLAERYLNELLSQPITRLEFVKIEYDDNGNAILKSDIMDDPSDRKFVAVALHFNPPALIINATDTDWEESKEKLVKNNIIVQELCPKYIEVKIK